MCCIWVETSNKTPAYDDLETRFQQFFILNNEDRISHIGPMLLDHLSFR
jgi:hypothetical protein